MNGDEKGPGAFARDAQPGKLSGGESTATPAKSQIDPSLWVRFRTGRVTVDNEGLGVRVTIGRKSLRANYGELLDLHRAIGLLLADKVRS